MPCVHLQELYELCEKHELRISSHDAIRVVCRQCAEQEVCPSSLTDGEQVIKMPTSSDDSKTGSGETADEQAPSEKRPR